MKLTSAVLCLVGCAILAGVIVPTGCGCGTSVETALTRQEIRQAGLALSLYRQEFGVFPPSTDNAAIGRSLTRDNPRKLSLYAFPDDRAPAYEFIDGWKRPLFFKTTPKGLLIRSAGRDGIFYTEDDITMEVVDGPKPLATNPPASTPASTQPSATPQP